MVKTSNFKRPKEYLEQAEELCLRLKLGIEQYESLLEMEESLQDMKKTLEISIEKARAEFLTLDDDIKERMMAEFGRFLGDGIGDVQRNVREEEGEVTGGVESDQDSLEDLQDKVDDEMDDTFFDVVNLEYLKCREFKVYDKVVIKGGTKFGKSEICTIEKMANKRPLLMDADGQTFRKDFKFLQKVRLLTKNSRHNWMVDD